MLKKIFYLCVALGAFFSFGIVQAAELAPAGTPARKMQRGFLNVALAPIEIVYHLHESRKQEFPPGWVLGSLEGIGAAAGRALIGIYELVTTPFPSPSGDQPILTPEFAWELLQSPSSPEPQKRHKR